MSNTLKQYYKVAGEATVKALKRRHFDAYYVDSGEEALELALSLIPMNHRTGWGGSMTLEQIGIKDALRARGSEVIDRDTAKTPEERIAIMKQAMLSDTFLMSTSAVTADGQLFNIDGSGNRMAALCYGPESVIVIAGMNKFVPDMESAVKRTRNIAGPANSLRFEGDTPCMFTGVCADCIGTSSICAQMVTTRLCLPEGRIKVILVGEDLGL